MSHELSIRADGTAEMAYVGDVPWHHLGTRLDKNASKADRVKAAGYDWTIMRAEAEFTVNGQRFVVPNRDVLYRSNNNFPLGVVSSKSFKEVQPSKIMDYFEELITGAGFEFETAGMLHGGKRFWALANIGEESYIADPNDRVKGRLLVATSVDGTMATRVKFLCERVVCQNTLTWGLAEVGGTELRIPHSKVFDTDEVNEKMGIRVHNGFGSTIDQFRRLAETPMDDHQMVAATLALIAGQNPENLPEDEYMGLLASKPVQRIGELATEGRAIGAELAGADGTAWGWLNSVTQFVDHEGPGRTADNRLSRCWFGPGDRMKSQAFNMALALADGTETTVTNYIDQADNSGLLDQVLELTA